MKWFDFGWFKSEERKKLEQLQIKELELKNELLENTIDDTVKQQFKPYKKLIYTNGSITAVLGNGIVITKKGCDRLLFDKIRDAYSEDVVRNLLLPDTEPIVNWTTTYTEEEIGHVKKNLNVFDNHADFIREKDSVYLKGVKLPLVPVVLASFIEIIEKLRLASVDKVCNDSLVALLNKQYTSLKMFWLKLATSPRQESREQVLKFCKENDIKLSKTGNIIGYRRVVPWDTDEELNDFVTEQYTKIKNWKKSPANYVVHLDIKGAYFIMGVPLLPHNAINDKSYVGNLAELKASQCEKTEQYYTSQYNKGKYVFKIGDVYKATEEDRLNESELCSAGSGIHFASVEYDYSGFGAVPVVVLINPAKTVVIPKDEMAKGRTLEMKIACINPNMHGVHINEDLIEKADEEYNEFTIDELEQAVASKDFSSLCIEEEVPVINLVELKDITEQLRNRVVSI